jgi:formylglycine-generating enzyme required for sulfatase activity
VPVEEVAMVPRYVIDTYRRDLTQVVSKHGLDIFRTQPPRPSNQKTIRVCCGGPTEARLQGFKDLFETDETSVQTDTIHANNSLIGYMQAQVVLLFFKDRADFNAWVADGVEADFLRLTQPVNGEKRFGVYCTDRLPLDEIRDILGSDNVGTDVDLGAAMRDLGQQYAIESYVDSMVMVPSGKFIHGKNGRAVMLPDDARGIFAGGAYLLGDPVQTEGAVFYGCAPRIEGALNLGDQPAFDLTSVSKPFLMAQSQTTQALYKAATGADPSHFKAANRPVDKVSWFDMLRFANALSGDDACYTDIGSGHEGTAIWHHDCTGLRLLTEREWEYAARAFGPFSYSGSDSVGAVGWYRGNSNCETHPVGQLKPNTFGTYDMSGNVWEWCWDLYRPGSANRVLRGGSWLSDAGSLRAANRLNLTPAYQGYYNGGRLSRSLP